MAAFGGVSGGSVNFILGYAAVAVFYAAMALVVFLARPGHALNRTLAAFFVLRAASDLSFEFMRQSGSPAEASAWTATAIWFDVGTIVPLGVLVILLFGASWRPAWRLVLLGAVIVTTTVLFAALVIRSDLLVGVISSTPAGLFAQPAPLGRVYGALIALIELGVVALAAWSASSTTLNTLQRRQVALVGVAFAVYLASAAVIWMGSIASSRLHIDRFPLGVLATIVILVATPRLAAAFEGRARGFVLGAIAVSFVAGTLDVAVLILANSGAIPHLPYMNTRIVWVAASALILALAVVRFGLAGYGAPIQRRLAGMALVGVAVSVALLPAGLVLALLGKTPAGLVAAAALGVAALTVSTAPIRKLAGAASRAIVLDPASKDVAAERARIYAGSIRLAADGRLRGMDDATLRELRRELGLTDFEHAEIAQALADNAQAPAKGRASLLGRYAIERELGRGAFGSVFLVRDAVGGRLAVVKRFHTGRSTRGAVAEARALAAVRHPRVVRLLHVEGVNDEIFLVMAFAPGGSARDLLAREGPLPVWRATLLAADLLEGLEAIHAAGLVHADVKAGNLLLDEDGRGVVGDFGSARALDGSDVDLTLTGADVMGTYSTVAPEVLRGARPSAASDVYGAGAVLYRLLTGEHYVELSTSNAFQTRQVILHEHPRLPHASVPDPIARVISRALAKAPEDRFESAAQMRAALDFEMRVVAAVSRPVEEEKRAPDADDVPVS